MKCKFVPNSNGLFAFLNAVFSILRSRILLVLVFLLMMIQGTSQNKSGHGAESNELKLNVLYLPGGYPELSYERILGNHSAVGISFGFLIDSGSSNYATDILTFDKAMLPYYRYYFGQKRAAGFFLEGNSIFYSEKSMVQDERESGWGLGMAVGIKLINSDNWHIDVIAGGGLGVNGSNTTSEFLNFPDLYPRLGLAIGKRF